MRERLTAGLNAHHVQIIQGCIGIGKTFFVKAWSSELVNKDSSWSRHLYEVDGEGNETSRRIFEDAQKEDALGRKTLIVVDNIDRIDDFSTFVNSMNSLKNISCVGTSDVNIRVTKKAERTHFADRCIFLNFSPLSYLDCLSLLNVENDQSQKISNYLFAGGIPTILLSKNPRNAVADMRKKILFFVQKTFRLSNGALLANLFDSYCRFARFPANQLASEQDEEKNNHSHNTVQKYTKALSTCFAISELSRVNADYFTALRYAPVYLPLDSCFQPSDLSFNRRLENAIHIAIYNRLISDGCIVSVSVVNRQKPKNGKWVYEQIENGFLASKPGRIWFVVFAWDDGASGIEVMKELRNGFPKIIVVLPETACQTTSEGFYLIGLSLFLKEGTEAIKKVI